MFGKKKTPEYPGPLPGSNAAPIANNDVLMRLAEDYMNDRKWRRFFRFLVLGLIILYLMSALLFAGSAGSDINASRPHTALVDLSGPIGIKGGVFADQMNVSLRRAFEAKQSKGVVLRINSPGGSPVQSDEINSEITRLRTLYPNKPLHVVVSDICASGGYYVAAAADSIYANPSSIVGSIGVRMDSFGFVDTLEKLGVERRSLTAGENKSILDPFLPVKPAQKAHAEAMLNIVHQQFIDKVKQGRGDKLADNPDLFSGLFWSGEQAKMLGLVDDFGSLQSVARDVIGQETVVDYTFKPSFLDQLASDFGVSIGTGIANVFGGSMILR
ncbi:S49 family peptidase [Arenicella xantha]|uniref:Protease-4 n=1 Tax=Arenicella xantha TaxID=644221 RepID=A0A395JLC7_9GAMM|nr:S49 family peptidase [Arenicella xantha]RBP51521.1 protease-4 [Arenicella xantha]